MSIIQFSAQVSDVKLTKREGGGYKVILSVPESEMTEIIKLIPIATHDANVKVSIEM